MEIAPEFRQSRDVPGFYLADQRRSAPSPRVPEKMSKDGLGLGGAGAHLNNVRGLSGVSVVARYQPSGCPLAVAKQDTS